LFGGESLGSALEKILTKESSKLGGRERKNSEKKSEHMSARRKKKAEHRGSHKKVAERRMRLFIKMVSRGGRSEADEEKGREKKAADCGCRTRDAEKKKARRCKRQKKYEDHPRRRKTGGWEEKKELVLMMRERGPYSERSKLGARRGHKNKRTSVAQEGNENNEKQGGGENILIS